MSKEILLALATITAQPQAPVSRGVEVAVTCFSKGEQAAGMNKICYYDCLGSTAAITISAVALCPLTIEQ